MCGSVHFNACELGRTGSALGSALQVPRWLLLPPSLAVLLRVGRLQARCVKSSPKEINHYLV